MIHYHNYRFNASILDCEFEYEPAERGSRENGQQMEPDYPATLTLYAAYLNRVDIMDLLSDEIIEDIEADAMEGTND